MTKLAGRYTVVQGPLNGGMGSVYICNDEVLERKVALKVLQDGTEARRFVDEISALLSLRSKHVVQVYDLAKIADNHLGIVQEFVDGSDLFDARHLPTTAQAFYKLAWQMASGIADIHSTGLIHRDIKPNNMKVDAEGIVKVFDFGLARRTGFEAQTLGFVGTQWFAAPELYTDGDVHFSPAIDTYAFGVTAIYLLTHQLPSELGSQPPGRLPRDYISGSSTIDIDEEIDHLLIACLDPEPNSRPEMSFVRDSLAKHLLRDRHQALVVHQGRSSYLNSTRRRVVASVPGIGSITVAYNGTDFIVDESDGEVFINYAPAAKGQRLPASCVVALGEAARGASRKYVTFDISSPEVVL